MVDSKEQKCSKSVVVAQEQGRPKSATTDMKQNAQRALKAAEEQKWIESARNYQRPKVLRGRDYF